MLERYERAIKIACVILGAVLLFELVNAVFRHNPLEHMKIPALPVLATAADTSTNAGPLAGKAKSGMNVVTNAAAEKSANGTNAGAGSPTNQPGTNAISAAAKEGKNTNSAPVAVTTNAAATNLVAGPEHGVKGTNVVGGTNLVLGTNMVSGTNVAMGSNAPAQTKPGKQARNRIQRGGPGKAAAELPPVIQARVDKIVDSEILGPVNRPLPMGLLGIAGEYAFLRASSGQTGLVKQGDELGGLKLLRIGINRVLVEEGGEKKELTIFDGYGSETLMPKQNEKPNETIKKPKQ